MNNCGTKYKLIELLNTIENAFFCECQKDKLKDLFIDIFNDENLFVVFISKIDEVKKLLKNFAVSFYFLINAPDICKLPNSFGLLSQ